MQCTGHHPAFTVFWQRQGRTGRTSRTSRISKPPANLTHTPRRPPRCVLAPWRSMQAQAQPRPRAPSDFFSCPHACLFLCLVPFTIEPSRLPRYSVAGERLTAPLFPLPPAPKPRTTDHRPQTRRPDDRPALDANPNCPTSTSSSTASRAGLFPPSLELFLSAARAATRTRHTTACRRHGSRSRPRQGRLAGHW